jgi:hypothetical protein
VSSELEESEGWNQQPEEPRLQCVGQSAIIRPAPEAGTPGRAPTPS